jgi:hypothetical protein
LKIERKNTIKGNWIREGNNWNRGDSNKCFVAKYKTQNFNRFLIHKTSAAIAIEHSKNQSLFNCKFVQNFNNTEFYFKPFVPMFLFVYLIWEYFQKIENLRKERCFQWVETFGIVNLVFHSRTLIINDLKNKFYSKKVAKIY